MKLRAWWPALAGIVALVVLYLAVRTRRDPDATPPARPTPEVAVASAPPEHPPIAPPTAPAPVAASVDTTAVRPASAPPATAPAPDAKPKKPKMTLDDRLAEAQKHVDVMARRVEILDKEVTTLEQAGKTKEAAEQRIVIKRIRAHMDQLRSAIAERRDPE